MTILRSPLNSSKAYYKRITEIPASIFQINKSGSALKNKRYCFKFQNLLRLLYFCAKIHFLKIKLNDENN